MKEKRKYGENQESDIKSNKIDISPTSKVKKTQDMQKTIHEYA